MRPVQTRATRYPRLYRPVDTFGNRPARDRHRPERRTTSGSNPGGSPGSSQETWDSRLSLTKKPGVRSFFQSQETGYRFIIPANAIEAAAHNQRGNCDRIPNFDDAYEFPIGATSTRSSMLTDQNIEAELSYAKVAKRAVNLGKKTRRSPVFVPRCWIQRVFARWPFSFLQDVNMSVCLIFRAVWIGFQTHVATKLLRGATRDNDQSGPWQES